MIYKVSWSDHNLNKFLTGHFYTQKNEYLSDETKNSFLRRVSSNNASDTDY